MLSFVCVACDKPVSKLRRRGSLDTCPPCVKRRVLADWKAKYPERKRALNRKWAARNPDADRAAKRKWDQANPAALTAKAAEHRARRRSATPGWADRALTKDIYTLARIWSEAVGVDYQVDHIVPLNGNEVCGLHWHANLQILESSMNRAKSNRLEGNP